MTALDRKALLQKNAQVDGKLLVENQQKIAEARKLAGKKPERPVVSPYGGRKLIPDDSDRARMGLDIRKLPERVK